MRVYRGGNLSVTVSSYRKEASYAGGYVLKVMRSDRYGLRPDLRRRLCPAVRCSILVLGYGRFFQICTRYEV